MPVLERPVHVRDRVSSKNREKRKTGKVVEFLVIAVMVTVAGESAYRMLDCITNHKVPEVPTLAVPTPNRVLDASSVPNHQDISRKQFIMLDEPERIRRSIDAYKEYLKEVKAKPSKMHFVQQDCYEFPKHHEFDAIGWKKNNTADLAQEKANLNEILKEMAYYKRLDAIEHLFAKEFFWRKAMLEYILMVARHR